MQVEYKPCVVPANCWELMREFIQGFLGPSVPVQVPTYLQNRINELFQPLDTIHQYLDHFSQYRKSTGII
uniref:Mediator of RNA polymerase II transcription subunit 20 n=1 Tax=Trichogramma kaykai TaxID=54128 RepID=A0ABD2VZ83_9HYME